MANIKKETTKSAKFAQGGKTHMFGEQAAEKQTPGVTADQTASDSAPGDKYACGGKTKMFGFSGSQPARAGITSAR